MAKPGAPTDQSQQAELQYWAGGGVVEHDLHLRGSQHAFPFHALDCPASGTLDAASGHVDRPSGAQHPQDVTFWRRLGLIAPLVH